MKPWRWVKLPIAQLTDPLYGRLTDRLYRRCVELRLLAGQEGHDGRLPCLEDMAYHLRCEPDHLQTECVELEDKGILSRDEGNWRFTSFERDQAGEDPTAAERMRRYRERNVTRNVTGGYEPVTRNVTRRVEESREEERRGDVTRNVTRNVTPPASPPPSVKGFATIDAALKGKTSRSDF